MTRIVTGLLLFSRVVTETLPDRAQRLLVVVGRGPIVCKFSSGEAHSRGRPHSSHDDQKRWVPTAMSEGLISIVVVDDHWLVRLGLTNLFGKLRHFAVVAEASTAADAIAAAG